MYLIFRFVKRKPDVRSSYKIGDVEFKAKFEKDKSPKTCAAFESGYAISK